jgi:D-alanyl-D-alanine carboxypeptidase (penicillin-binding protein 5/6)
MKKLKNFIKQAKTICKKQRSRFLLFSVFAALLFLFPSPNEYFRETAQGKGLFTPETYSLPAPPAVPVNRTEVSPPRLSAAGILIIDLPSNITLLNKAAGEKFPPASTTKLITALVSLDKYKPDDVFTVKTVISEGRVMDLVSGEKLTLESLLYGALAHSANDAAYAIAENYPGGVEAFVAAMNNKAKSLHLDNSHFTNPIGFDDPGHYTTAYDLAKLAKVALSDKILAKIFSTKSITVSDVDFTYFHELKNVNELLGKVPGVAGVKTGFTENGGEILISEVKKYGKSILLVVLKSNDRFGDTEKLIDWVFNNFQWIDLQEIAPTP